MKLCNIEFKKYKKKVILLIFLSYLLLMMLLLFLIGNSTGEIYMFQSMQIALNETNQSIIWPSCILFSAIYINMMFIGEFKNKTIGNVVVAGIERKKIVTTKLVVLATIITVATLLSTLVLDGFIILTKDVTYYTRSKINTVEIINYLFAKGTLLNTLTASLLSFIALEIGMINISSTFTFVGSIFVAVLWAFKVSIGDIGINEVKLLALALELFFLIFIYRKVKLLTI